MEGWVEFTTNSGKVTFAVYDIRRVQECGEGTVLCCESAVHHVKETYDEVIVRMGNAYNALKEASKENGEGATGC